MSDKNLLKRLILLAFLTQSKLSQTDKLAESKGDVVNRQRCGDKILRHSLRSCHLLLSKEEICPLKMMHPPPFSKGGAERSEAGDFGRHAEEGLRWGE